jgi:LacI family transcriptional regulator
MKRVTIKDLARELGVSPSTISKALADSSEIGESTKHEVRELAQKLNYRPNLRAKYLQANHTDIIALIVPDINMFFVPELIYGINTIAREHGYAVMMFQSDDDFEKEKALLEYAYNLPVEGIIISLSEETKSTEHLSVFTEVDIPVVMADKIIPDLSIPSVSIDDSLATQKAVDYLIAKGHKNVLGIFGNPSLTMTQLRIDGFKNTMLPILENPLILSTERILELEEKLEKYLVEMPGITAIFTMSDELMVYTHYILNKKSIPIPDDISLISISDGFAPYNLHPNITHIHHSGFEIGVQAMNALLTALKKRTEYPPEYIKTNLCELESVKDCST